MLEKKNVYISDADKSELVDSIENLIRRRNIDYSNKRDGKLREYSIVGTGVSVVFSDFSDNKPSFCEVIIGEEKFTCASKELINRLYSAFKERHYALGQKKVSAKGQELAKKLQMMIDNSIEI